MTHLLQSYCQGRWQGGTGEQRPLRDAATGEIVAVIPSRGLDYARGTGGPALRELTFSQRAGIGTLAVYLTRDTATALRIIAGLAPWHGRPLVLNSDDGAESTGHGVAMPQLVHGGPGRAGGAELGGLRALERYLQRTAIQGPPGLLSRLSPILEET
jgi:hypothetical protein